MPALRHVYARPEEAPRAAVPGLRPGGPPHPSTTQAGGRVPPLRVPVGGVGEAAEDVSKVQAVFGAAATEPLRPDRVPPVRSAAPPPKGGGGRAALQLLWEIYV